MPSDDLRSGDVDPSTFRTAVSGFVCGNIPKVAMSLASNLPRLALV